MFTDINPVLGSVVLTDARPSIIKLPITPLLEAITLCQFPSQSDDKFAGMYSTTPGP